MRGSGRWPPDSSNGISELCQPPLRILPNQPSEPSSPPIGRRRDLVQASTPTPAPSSRLEDHRYPHPGALGTPWLGLCDGSTTLASAGAALASDQTNPRGSASNRRSHQIDLARSNQRTTPTLRHRLMSAQDLPQKAAHGIGGNASSLEPDSRGDEGLGLHDNAGNDPGVTPRAQNSRYAMPGAIAPCSKAEAP